MLGGSSALNGAIYTRGNRKDYDNWAALGNPGWSFDDILPLFIRAERFLVDEVPPWDAPYHGTKGYLPVSQPYFTELLPLFIEAGQSLGFPHNHDHNGASQYGFGRLQTTVAQGIRYSSAQAYLTPVRHRRNLQVVLNTVVSRIVMDEGTMTAKGIEYVTADGSTRFVSARREVILSAGAVASPQILMLSGIGPKNELRKHNIRALVDLPVGENLQSHTGPAGLYFSIKEMSGFFLPEIFTTRLISSTLQYVLRGNGPFSAAAGFEGIAFVNTSFARDPDWPDMELFFVSFTIGSDGGAIYRPIIGLGDEAWKTYEKLLRRPGFGIYPFVLRPKSRGKILLRSTDITDHPVIIGNYFKHPEDLKSTIEAIRLLLRVGEQPAFKKIGAEFHSQPLPGCRHLKQFTDEYWECHIRQFTYLHWHDVGTCKMGPPTDPEAVVDPSLRVYGVKNLRVADASIMPVITSGHTMAACIVIGEKASDLIKMDQYGSSMRLIGNVVWAVGVILSSKLFLGNELDNPVGFSNYKLRVGESYDFIIVGGGTTGSVIASRLTENPTVKVLLIEAGSDGSRISFIPAFASFMWWFTKFDYGYTSEPQEDSCLALEGRASAVFDVNWHAIWQYCRMDQYGSSMRLIGNVVWAVGVILSSKLFLGNELDNPVGFSNYKLRVGESYDFIIVGGGTTGSVIASRLTENPTVKVLLIEAGSDGSRISFIPAFASFMWWFTKFDYGYTSEPQEDSCLALEGGGKATVPPSSYRLLQAESRRLKSPHITAVCLSRLPGWIDTFECYCSRSIGDASYHGTEGYFPISHSYITDVLPAFIEAGKSLGFPHNKDYNGESQIGFSRVQVATKRGIRHSTASAYLTPVKHRKNLHVLLNAPVSKIVIEEATRTAKGIEYVTDDGTTHFIAATREVILSAGVVASPQILMLSGIGPKKELKKHGCLVNLSDAVCVQIQPLVNLPVGKNLQSHVGPGGLYFTFKTKSGLYPPKVLTVDLVTHLTNYIQNGEGPFSSPSGFEGVAFVNTSYASDPDWPDIEMLLSALTIGTDGGYIYSPRIGLSDETWRSYRGLKLRYGFGVYPHPSRPKSRGKILLRSANIKDHPIIIGNYFKDPYDLKITIEAIRLVLQLGEQPAFKKLGAKFYSQPLPGCKHLEQFTDEYWECHIRQFTYLHWHDVGTCKMGPPTDPDAVVDPSLKVYGVKRLRVADASIMPEMVSGNTMAACIMIGEKASDLIKMENYGISLRVVSKVVWAMGFLLSRRFFFEDLDNPVGFSNDNLRVDDSYDFIIVGGGTTGSVIANRLTGNHNVRVLVIEAGSDGTKLSFFPALASFMWWYTKFDYRYTSEPQEDSCLALKRG
ncbi:unnamed protein product, partial [Darwinula stevensoni]